MIKWMRTTVITLSLLALGSLLVSPAMVGASTASDSACDGVRLLDSNAKCKSTDAAASQSAFSGILQTLINIFSIVVGAVSVIMIIIGGFRYIISGGDSSSTKSAKDTILYAVIGLAIVIFAQTIVRFVITRTTEKPAAPSKKSTFVVRNI